MGVVAWAVVAGVGTVVLTVPILAPAVLPALGFGTAGVGAGTVAASAQSYVGNVAAGAVFAKLQALAMAAPTP
ncbi:uncharacterized protein LOC124354129 [Homalodisca vitripennis]|uniref:uncharacterized protein LOC124354129 n=1 Tax=Homalodisca vitripennis TaxID=197043 RepID=UPI001EEB3D7B|nr:uncharacterized protein LOC124354129 [Homalodisca vitripennis]